MAIYFLLDRNDNTVKIGFSRDVEKRVRQLQTGNPRKLKLLGIDEDGTLEDEQRLHNLLSHFRVSGEWFDYQSPAVKRVCREMIKSANSKEETKQKIRAQFVDPPDRTARPAKPYRMSRNEIIKNLQPTRDPAATPRVKPDKSMFTPADINSKVEVHVTETHIPSCNDPVTNNDALSSNDDPQLNALLTCLGAIVLGTGLLLVFGVLLYVLPGLWWFGTSALSGFSVAFVGWLSIAFILLVWIFRR